MSCSSEDCDTDQETDRLLGAQRAEDRPFFEDKVGIRRPHFCEIHAKLAHAINFLSSSFAKFQKQPIKKKNNSNSNDGMRVAFC